MPSRDVPLFYYIYWLILKESTKEVPGGGDAQSKEWVQLEAWSLEVNTRSSDATF